MLLYTSRRRGKLLKKKKLNPRRIFETVFIGETSKDIQKKKSYELRYVARKPWETGGA